MLNIKYRVLKVPKYADATKKFSDLVQGFWEGLSKRMQKGKSGSGGQKGVVIATGSGLSLDELARQEEEETGIRPDAFLLGAAQPPQPEPATPMGTGALTAAQYAEAQRYAQAAQYGQQYGQPRHAPSPRFPPSPFPPPPPPAYPKPPHILSAYGGQGGRPDPRATYGV